MDGASALSKALDGKIAEDCFFNPVHRNVWKSILWLHNHNRPIDLAVMAEELRKKNKIEELGGYSALTEIANHCPTTAQFSYFLEQVRELYVLRRLIETAEQTAELAYGRQGTVEDFVAKTNQILAIRHANQNVQTLEEASEDAIQKAIRIKAGEQKEEDKGIEWPWADWNKRFGPLNGGELCILGARPGVGKSSSARQCALEWATGGDVLLFSREMPLGDLPYLFAQQTCGHSWRHFRRCELFPKAQDEYIEALREVKRIKRLHIFDRDRTMAQVTARAKAFSQVKPIRAIIIDYLQRYDPQQERGETRDVALGRMSMAFKDIAVDLKIPVLLLAQVGRGVEREQREPRLSDLRESGNLEQDADRVIFLHVPDTNRQSGVVQDPTNGDLNELYVEAIQAKGRGEGQHKAEMIFKRQTTTFTNIQTNS
jgi:replicative DNA helicase